MKINYLILILVIIIMLSIIVLLILENMFLRQKTKDNNLDQNVIAIGNDETFLEKKIINNSSNPNYKIKVYYPYTSYESLNKIIDEAIKKIIDEFIATVLENKTLQHQFYTLNINYDKYQYKDYLSYVFYISVYTGGAHPNNTILTISYAKNKDKIITIDDLAKQYPALLNNLSNESRSYFVKDQNFNDNDIKDMLIDGTMPNQNNFKNFAFSEMGLLIFFEQYQIAPYSYGEFEIVIPYSKIF